MGIVGSFVVEEEVLVLDVMLYWEPVKLDEDLVMWSVDLVQVMIKAAEL